MIQALYEVAAASFGARPQSDMDPARIRSVRHYALICSDYPLTLAAGRAEEATRSLLLHELRRLQIIVAADPRAAEEDIRLLDKIALPESAEELWRDGRDRLLRQVAAEKGR